MLLLVAFFSLATGSLLIPVPEELLVGVVGFSAFVGAAGMPLAALYLAMALLPCCLAVVCGDVLIWFLGMRLGLAARNRFRFLARAASDERVATVERLLLRYGALAILIARLVPGARMCTFFVAGASRMPLSRFVLFDFLGSLVSVSLCLALGALAAHEEYGAAWAREAAGSAASIAVLGIVTAALAVWVGAEILRRARKETPVTPASVLTQD